MGRDLKGRVAVVTGAARVIGAGAARVIGAAVVVTDVTDGEVAQVKGTDVEQLILSSTPMGRMGRSEEVAEVITFQPAIESSYTTSSEVYVDGGWTAQ